MKPGRTKVRRNLRHRHTSRCRFFGEAKVVYIKNLAPHDLRPTCARLCHLAGGELEKIQFLLGHASV